MQKRAPTLGNIFVIVLFVLSCFGLLLFLWESFGGPLPLKPKGYRMVVAFPRALALAEQSDVRISGVDVGHVVSLKLGKEGRTDATLEIESQYAPLRSNMHAILRQKTLLGETYVQLIPEGNDAPFLPDGGKLARQPGRTVGDARRHPLRARTRRRAAPSRNGSSRWRRGSTGRGNRSTPTSPSSNRSSNSANKLVSVLASQEGAVTALVHNTGVVFNALAGRDHELEELIVNSEHTFHAAAEGSQAFAQAFRELPAFEHNSTVALKELDKFADDTNPFLDEFRPAERQLAQLSKQTKTLRAAVQPFLTALGPLTKAAKLGLPDVAKELGLTVPLLENTSPVLHNFDPFLQYVGEYVPELQSLFANVTAASEAHDTNADDAAGRVAAALPALDAGGHPAGPGGLLPADRHRPGQPVLQARRLQLARQRAARVQRQHVRELGAGGDRPGQRDRHAGHHRTADRTARRQRAGKPPTRSPRRPACSRARSRSTGRPASSRTSSTAGNRRFSGGHVQAGGAQRAVVPEIWQQREVEQIAEQQRQFGGALFQHLAVHDRGDAAHDRHGDLRRQVLDPGRVPARRRTRGLRRGSRRAAPAPRAGARPTRRRR